MGGDPAVDQHEGAVGEEVEVVERPADERGPVISAETAQLPSWALAAHP